MPVVPFTNQPVAPRDFTSMSQARPAIPEPFALMAAAQMHAEGRLIKKDTPTDASRTDR